MDVRPTLALAMAMALLGSAVGASAQPPRQPFGTDARSRGALPPASSLHPTAPPLGRGPTPPATPATPPPRLHSPSASPDAQARHAAALRSPVSRTGAPSTTPLRWAAERGNRGGSPPRDDPEWRTFSDPPMPSDHVARLRHPDVAVMRPLAGVRPTAYTPRAPFSPAQLTRALTSRGVSPAIAARAARHIGLGLPSQANRASRTDYLVARNDHVMSYNDEIRGPNWVSWSTGPSEVGERMRSDHTWRADPSLPRNFTPATFGEYDGAGYDPGHMLRSAERTASPRANERTYVMSNTLPQAKNVNQGPWLAFERYYEALVRDRGQTAHVIAGGAFGARPNRIGNGIPVPTATWKIVVMLDRGQTLADIGPRTRVMAVMMPNNDVDVPSRQTPFGGYVTSVREIERATGLRFFSSLPSSVANALRDQVDGGALRDGATSASDIVR